MRTKTFRPAFVPMLLLSLGCGALLTLAENKTSPASAREKSATDSGTGVASKLMPGPDDSKIAIITARILQQMHYSHMDFDDTVSSNLLHHYLNDLDPQHLHFTKADWEEFEPYTERLDDLILRKGDTTAAYRIFIRFLERLEQRITYMNDLLTAETFEFTADETVVLNRKDAPPPKDLADAKQLWRDRLRAEYLQEKLNLTGTNATRPAGINASSRQDAKTGGETGKSVKARTPEEVHTEIVALLSKRYARNLKMFKDWDGDDVLQVFLTALARVYDPHSDYMGRQQSEQFAISMNLALFGIGAELRSEDGYCKINKLVAGGPAMQSKRIKPNDRVVGVAQGDGDFVDVVDMPLNKVVSLIRGPKDTVVRLKVIPASGDASAREVLSLVRKEIKLEDQEAKARIIELPNEQGETVRLGVIDLPSFYTTFDLGAARGKAEPRSTTADVTKLLRKLKEQNVAGIILDLRRNGGGSLEEAIRLTGLFIREGPVVQVKDPDGTVTVDEDKDPSILYDGPMMVLTSRFSASASEILAGALQDYGRALTVGDSSTHGKGTVQTVSELRRVLRGSFNSTNDPGAVKVTIRKFYRPSGASTQVKGVVPDIILPSQQNEWEVGEASLENPLPYDTIESASFDTLNRVEPYLEVLRKNSNARIATDREFEYVLEDVELYKKALAEKTVSLNEAERLKDKQEADARQKARDKERRVRKSPELTTYELTLKQAGEPGLPPPGKPETIADTGRDESSTTTTTSAASTNPTADSTTSTQTTETIAEDDDPPVPTTDVAMTEAERILLDYITLLTKVAPLTVKTRAD